MNEGGDNGGSPPSGDVSAPLGNDWGNPQPRPWGAPAPEPNPYAPPPMPEAPPPPPHPSYGVPPAPSYGTPPSYGAPAYGVPFDGTQGRPPRYPGAAAGFAQPGYGLPPPPPPPPPGYGMPDFGIPKPHSGKATASLVCAGIGVVGGGMCGIPVIAIPVGLVLGIMGMMETGASGTRSGRGIAVAGTVINALCLIAAIVGIALITGIIMHENQRQEERFATRTEKDFDLIRNRMKTYYEANNRSLGPGGKRLTADRSGTGYCSPPRSTGRRVETVAGALTIQDLVGAHELDMPLSQYELIVTGPESANVRFENWRGGKSRVMKILDISVPRYIIEDE